MPQSAANLLSIWSRTVKQAFLFSEVLRYGMTQIYSYFGTIQWWCTFFTQKVFNYRSGISSICPPPPPQYVMRPQLKRTCHYIVNHHVKTWRVRLGGANNMRQLSWTVAGAQTEKIERKKRSPQRRAAIWFGSYLNNQRRGDGCQWTHDKIERTAGQGR